MKGCTNVLGAIKIEMSWCHEMFNTTGTLFLKFFLLFQ